MSDKNMCVADAIASARGLVYIERGVWKWRVVECANDGSYWKSVEIDWKDAVHLHRKRRIRIALFLAGSPVTDRVSGELASSRCKTWDEVVRDYMKHEGGLMR